MLGPDSGFVIAVEGCDRTGKTTLCQGLSKMLGWPIVKFNQPVTADPMAEYVAALREHPESFIADRFYVGESVYGPIYRGTARIEDSRVAAFEGGLTDARGALLVYTEDDAARIARRFDGEDFAKVADIRLILDLYDYEFARSMLPKVRMTMAVGTQLEKITVVAALAKFIHEARA